MQDDTTPNPQQDTSPAPADVTDEQTTIPVRTEEVIPSDTPVQPVEAQQPVEQSAPQQIEPPTVPQSTITATPSNTDVPKKKAPKKLIIALVAIIAVMVLSTAGAFAFMSLQTSPEERLQTAIINSASVTALTQTTQIDATIEGGSDLSGTVTTQRDVSDPSNPKAKATVDLDVALLGITIELKSEYICVSQKDCYVKYNEFKVPEELSTKDNSAFLGQWLKFDPTNAEQKADPFEILGSINTVLGEIITGNITGAAKDTIVAKASDNATYTFTSSSKEKVADANTVKYNLSLDGNGVLDINKAVADQYKLKNVFTTANDVTDTAVLWVNTSDNMIAQVEVNANNIKSVISYSNYNDTPQITAPESFLTPEQYNAIF